MRLALRRGIVLAAGVVLLAALLPTTAFADDTYQVPDDGRLQVHGHGFGHGRGMSQYGAREAAQRGRTWRRILAFYYPGTELGQVAGKSIRALITADTTTDLVISPATGLTLRDLGDGETWRLDKPSATTDRWALRTNADNDVVVFYHDGKGWHRWQVPGRGHLQGEGQFQAREPLTLWVPGSGGTVSHRYRGRLRTAKPSADSKKRDTVNVLPLQKYLQGVLASEMPALWNRDALRSQAVAARTYAVRHRRAHPERYFHVDDTIRYQVYRGVGAEHDRTNQALADTAGTIVTHQGAPALTEYSSSSGGWTAGSNLAYQQVMEDPYDTPANPNHDWTKTVDAARLEKAYPGIGSLQRIVVTQRNGAGQWGGRVEQASLVGSRGSRTVTGSRLRAVWSLRSRWFSIAQPDAPGGLEFDRVAGPDRYATSVEAAEELGSTNEAILVSGEPGHFPDALTANYLAGQLRAPILLTRENTTPQGVLTRLNDAGVDEVYLVGGSGVVSSQQAQSLRSKGYEVTRVAGDDRFSTAADVITEVGDAASETALVATGSTFPDALGGAPLSYAEQMPLAITKADDVPDAIIDALETSGVSRAVILGGDAVVSDRVVTELENNGITVIKRLAGRSRSDTSAKIASYATRNLGFTVQGADVASGDPDLGGVDALSGGPVSGENLRPLLITATSTRAGGIVDYVRSHADTLADGRIFGGTSAVSTRIQKTLEAAAR